MKKFTLKELNQMETLDQWHMDNVKLEKDNFRVLLSRMTEEDGMPYNNQVTEEVLKDGIWEIKRQYPAK